MGKSLKIGILQADSVLDEFQARFGNYPDMFKKVLLDAAEGPIDFSVYDIEHGVYPLALDECDGYFITGSKKSVYDDEPWIHRLREFVVELHVARKKLVGICFGHQMVALALGGNTEPAAAGWGVGVHESRIISHKPYMQPPLPIVAAIVSHKDQVTQLPQDAELVATSEFCPNAMFQVENHILTFQGHPEFCKSYSRALMDMRQDILGEPTYSRGILSLDQELQSQTLAGWMLRFIQNN